MATGFTSFDSHSGHCLHDRRTDQHRERVLAQSVVVLEGGTHASGRQAALKGDGIHGSFLPFAERGEGVD